MPHPFSGASGHFLVEFQVAGVRSAGYLLDVMELLLTVHHFWVIPAHGLIQVVSLFCEATNIIPGTIALGVVQLYVADPIV